MFEIYKMEYDFEFITAADLKLYVGMGILSQPDCDKILGDGSHEESNEKAEVQA
ncbi:XkdX family protein [Lactobacillus crispatus]|uniref:XkdX family protein n=1 Tax=Lactobacillus crispatus TaxID=47770 RepID=UPI001F095DFD|nr:XkdX family protein [Lactobacillus crispatus]MCT7686926.1 XkdX family protein [Lactobacillus crispatus]